MDIKELINPVSTFAMIIVLVFGMIIGGITSGLRNKSNRELERVQLKKMNEIVEKIDAAQEKLDSAVTKILIIEKLTDSPDQDTSDVQKMIKAW